MTFIFLLLVNAAILLGLSHIMPTVIIKNYTTAILVALVIGLLNATFGIFVRLPLNIITLGLLSFFVHLLVTAVMIKIADKLFDGFEVIGFKPALIIAVVMALVGSLITMVL